MIFLICVEGLVGFDLKKNKSGFIVCVVEEYLMMFFNYFFILG